MNGAQSKPRARAGMALAAGGGEILGVDCGFCIRRRQDVMYAMATGAIGHGLRPALGRQSVERRIERGDAIGRQPEPFCKLHIAVAMPARLAHIRGIHGGIQILRREDVVFAVAIGASRSLSYSLFHCLAMNARFVLFVNLGVAHAAGVIHTFAKFSGRGPPCVFRLIMRTGVAHRAIRRTRIPRFYRLPMDTGSIGLRDVLMA